MLKKLLRRLKCDLDEVIAWRTYLLVDGETVELPVTRGELLAEKAGKTIKKGLGLPLDQRPAPHGMSCPEGSSPDALDLDRIFKAS